MHCLQNWPEGSHRPVQLRRLLLLFTGCNTLEKSVLGWHQVECHLQVDVVIVWLCMLAIAP